MATSTTPQPYAADPPENPPRAWTLTLTRRNERTGPRGSTPSLRSETALLSRSPWRAALIAQDQVRLAQKRAPAASVPRVRDRTFRRPDPLCCACHRLRARHLHPLRSPAVAMFRVLL